MAEKRASETLQFALHIKAATDKLAQLHRSVEASDARPESNAQKCSRPAAAHEAPHTVAERSSQSAATARKLQIAKLAERVAAAAETLAQAQKKVAAKEAQPKANDVATAPSAAKLTSLVAKEARAAADRQLRCSAVPQAWEIELLGPEWMQRQLQRQMLSSAGELEQVRPTSDRRTLKLTCPLSGGFLKVPVRGVDCQHIDCFDLSSLRQSAPTGWRCPMVGCTASVAPELLRRDSFVEALLLHSNASSRAVALSSELASITTRGSPVKRARILAEHALSVRLQASPVKMGAKSVQARKALSKGACTPIEIDDSDCETSPQLKRYRRGRSSIGGA